MKPAAVLLCLRPLLEGGGMRWPSLLQAFVCCVMALRIAQQLAAQLLRAAQAYSRVCCPSCPVVRRSFVA